MVVLGVLDFSGSFDVWIRIRVFTRRHFAVVFCGASASSWAYVW